MKNAVSMQEKLATLPEDRASLLHLLLNRKSTQSPRAIESYPRSVHGEWQRMPASWAQRRMWFIDQLEGAAAAYNIPICIRLTGRLNREALLEALSALVHRHEALRTTFVSVGGELLQEIASVPAFDLTEVDLSDLTEDALQIVLVQHSNEEAALPFNLRLGPLIRGRLLSLGVEQHVLLVTMHHIVSDGWSLSVLAKELGELYQAHLEGRATALPALRIQYGDYAQWQKETFQGLVLERQLSYWQRRLAGAHPYIDLPLDHPRPIEQSYRGAVADIVLDAELSSRLRTFAQRHDMTLFMVLSAGWAILLSRLSGLDDVVFGTPVANRPRPELEPLIGLFVNTLALRVQVGEEQRLRDLLQQVKETMLGAYDHQDMPFERLVEALRPERAVNRHPLFQVMFSLQNAPKAALQLPGLHVDVSEGPNHAAKFDLLLWLEERDDRIVGSIKYAVDLFTSETVARWVAHFTTLLEAMAVADDGCLVHELKLMSNEERQRVIDGFNATRAPYPHRKLIHELFEEQAIRQPDALAVKSGAVTLTFSELDRRANRLASHLRQRGVGPDQLVGICVERTLELVVGVLGILKAGGAYVPLDQDYPTERLRDIIEDANPRVLLTLNGLQQRLALASAQIIALDADWSSIEQQSGAPLGASSIGLTSCHLAYVIYTSGSSGKPKGVMVEHRNVLSLWQGLEEIYSQAPACRRIGVNASFNFDASVKQLVQLLSGRGLVLVPTEARLDAQLLFDIIERDEIDGIDCTPWQLKAWIAAGLLERRAGQRLRMVLIGGEPIDKEMWSALACHHDIEFFNLYGPTESTVDTTFARLRGDDTSPHIGRPMQNRRIYVLDRRGEPLPVGVAGEIFIGGEGVARGYLNRAELTQDRFGVDPFAGDAQARMYKTGDVGRWRADGTIEYLGRNDDQVKIRGFRIELGEIEAQLVRHEAVREAAVMAREDVPGEKRLVAYLTRAGGEISIESLRAHLKSALPEYMAPSAFVVLDSLPLTPSGKLNRRALPAPDRAAYATREYQAPEGEIEEILAGIWQSLLRVERVGRQDNFFELGGHSLMIVQMLERLRRVGLTAEVRGVFESTSLSELARVLTRGASEPSAAPVNLIPAGVESITPQMLPLVSLQSEHIETIVCAVPGGAANIQDIYPLAPLQEGILFHYLLNEHGGDTYVLPTILRVSNRERLDALIEGLQAVIDRHDVLRTAVLWEQLPQPVQVVYRQARLPVEQLALAADRDVTEQVREWSEPGRQRMDLRTAPLMRLQVAADPHSQQWFVLLQIHHIVDDATSRKIAISEVIAHLNGRSAELPPSQPYRNHVAHALAYASTGAAEKFFSAKLSDLIEPTTPFGLKNVQGQSARWLEHRTEFDPELGQRLRAQARRLGVSAATVFHATWALVLAKTSGRDDVVFGSVLLGRLQSDAGAQRVLGMFINTLPLRVQIKDLTAKGLVEQTQRELIELMSHEQASLAVAQRCSGIGGSAPLFSSLLNYRHGARDADATWAAADGVDLVTSRAASEYAVTLSIDDLSERFLLAAHTDSRVAPQRLIDYLHTAAKSLLDALEQAPATSAMILNILPEAERRQVLESFNAAHLPYPQGQLIHELFEQQVRNSPTAVAAVCEGRSLTYGELNARADLLATKLRRLGVGPERLVAVFLERDLQMIVGIVAVLKAGGAYVPMDQHYPTERLAYMLRDCAPLVTLTQRSLLEQLPAGGGHVVVLDAPEATAAPVDDDDADPSEPGLSERHLAYIIYTSGSTGTPKGVAVEHRNLVNVIQWHKAAFQLSPSDRCSSVAGLGFDAAVWEIWPTLCAGATLVLAPALATADPETLLTWWQRQEVSVSFLPTPIAEAMFSRNVQHPHLRTLLVGGDQLRHRPVGSTVSLFNNYGPTEGTILATSGLIRDDDPVLHIGSPIANTRIYLLNSRLQPVPIGAEGEIYIGGPGVARGYLHRPEISADRFPADPFAKESGASMYRTGDVGRWRPDGSIEYLGRNDNQIKIRGFRIELGEIEAQLIRHPRIKDAVVVAQPDGGGDRRLVAYLVPTECTATDFDVGSLRAHLKTTLPEYMLPSAFVSLERLPITPNGKLDRKALPMPELADFARNEYQPVQGAMEETLAELWRGVLGLQQVGRNDNFFELGGHSLSGMRLVTLVQQRLHVQLPVTLVFQSPTIFEMALTVDALLAAGAESEFEEGIIPEQAHDDFAAELGGER